MGGTGPTRRDRLIAIGIGIAFMVIALIPQLITQEIPSIIVIIKYGLVKVVSIMSGFELSNPIIWALFVGGTAAVYQETMKYFSVNTQGRYLAIWIGLGFSLVDIAILLFEGGVLPMMVIGVSKFVTTLTTTTIVLIGLNAISSLLFHPGTALILKYGRTVKKGIYFLLFTILLHGIEDGGVVYTDLYVITHPGQYHFAVAVFWSIAIVVSLFAFVVAMSFRTKLYSERVEENLI